ncbi:GrpB family protein [Hymenobacter jejuensis]|uniref:GrpB family protein n=1 Tax=Hymenobacter jejuensis TaxID=2502781 RepID=A0A5B7ZV40_9BACT|nr:GrpB family protein [Hymenobacter jejuensis]QDA58840.1 GrpB family protein [Hymenobacter jejuensis]
MSNLYNFAVSRPVELVQYRAAWPDEFAIMAQRIRALVGNAVLRLDHIGSTAVPGLRAKDVIDIQLTVADLQEVDNLTVPLWQAGFRQGEAFQYDIFHHLPAASVGLRKRYMREPVGERRTHLHIRETGRFNTRFALLCRDYLRASAHASVEYELLKLRAASLFPASIEGYLFLKEPVFHLIYEAAELWATQTGWQLPASDA